MNKDFLKGFAEKPVRENAGARSSNRFDYQKNWSLCELLRLDKNADNYLMVFEHHDDIVVLNSETTPSDATYYQVKTKTKGNWTIDALIKSNNADGSKSILGKLYGNYLSFPKNTNKLVFTSNQGLSGKLKCGAYAISKNDVCFSDLMIVDKEKIQLTLEPSDSKKCDFFGLQKIYLQKTDLRLSDHTSITKGKLVEFFEQSYPERQVLISLVYKTFFDEIRRKTNHENDCSSVEDLQENKCIGRNTFKKMIHAVIQSRGDRELWSDANQALQSENFPFALIRSIRLQWQEYIVDKMNVENETLLQLEKAIQHEVKIIDENNNVFGTLKEIMAEILKRLSTEIKQDYSTGYVEAAILYEVVSDDSISAVNKKSTGEET